MNDALPLHNSPRLFSQWIYYEVELHSWDKAGFLAASSQIMFWEGRMGLIGKRIRDGGRGGGGAEQRAQSDRAIRSVHYWRLSYSVSGTSENHFPQYIKGKGEFRGLTKPLEYFVFFKWADYGPSLEFHSIGAEGRREGGIHFNQEL